MIISVTVIISYQLCECVSSIYIYINIRSRPDIDDLCDCIVESKKPYGFLSKSAEKTTVSTALPCLRWRAHGGSTTSGLGHRFVARRSTVNGRDEGSQEGHQHVLQLVQWCQRWTSHSSTRLLKLEVAVPPQKVQLPSPLHQHFYPKLVVEARIVCCFVHLGSTCRHWRYVFGWTRNGKSTLLLVQLFYTHFPSQGESAPPRSQPLGLTFDKRLVVESVQKNSQASFDSMGWKWTVENRTTTTTTTTTITFKTTLWFFFTWLLHIVAIYMHESICLYRSHIILYQFWCQSNIYSYVWMRSCHDSMRKDTDGEVLRFIEIVQSKRSPPVGQAARLGIGPGWQVLGKPLRPPSGVQMCQLVLVLGYTTSKLPGLPTGYMNKRLATYGRKYGDEIKTTLTWQGREEKAYHKPTLSNHGHAMPHHGLAYRWFVPKLGENQRLAENSRPGRGWVGQQKGIGTKVGGDACRAVRLLMMDSCCFTLNN